MGAEKIHRNLRRPLLVDDREIDLSQGPNVIARRAFNRATKDLPANSSKATIKAALLNNGLVSSDAGLTLLPLTLSSSSIAEDAAIGTVIGTLQNGQPGSVYSLIDNAGGLIGRQGDDIEVAAALDFETAESHQITVREFNAAANPQSRDTILTITVTNIAEGPVLNALGISPTQINQGEAVTINITGATAGSVISATGLPAGLALDSANRQITGTPAAISVYSITLTEALADSPNDGRQSIVSLDVIDSGSAADHQVANMAEWNALLAANTVADLLNKTIAFTGAPGDYDELLIDDMDFAALGGTLRLTSESGGKIRRLAFQGITKGIVLDGLDMQMTGWPADFPNLIQFNTGTFDFTARNCSFRHGYGAGLTNIDTAADLAEYNRTDNIHTATGVSAAYTVNHQDAAANDGTIWFWNNSAETLYVQPGDNTASVTVGGGVEPAGIAPGALERISIDPSAVTHIAVISAGGNADFNARSEIGLSYYLAAAFASFGSADVENVDIRHNDFADLRNGIKGIGGSTQMVVMWNRLVRIYQDIFATSPEPGSKTFYFFNTHELPFARSGIAQNDNGDAADPHGDLKQMFYNGVGTISRIYIGGNVILQTSRRVGCQNQGGFISDNDNVPSYTRLYFINDMNFGGAPRGIDSGEELYPVGDVLIDGCLVLDTDDLATGTMAVELKIDANSNVMVTRTIAHAFRALIGGVETFLPQSDNLDLDDAADINAVFPNLAAWAAANDRNSIISAFSTAAEGDGIGVAATTSTLDPLATDPEAVIQWGQVHSGLAFEDITNATRNAIFAVGTRRVLNEGTNIPISVGGGLRYRILDTDGVTELQAMGNQPGTVSFEQFVEFEFVTPDANLASTDVWVEANGIRNDFSIETEVVLPATHLTSQGGYFLDPQNPPAGIKEVRFEGTFEFVDPVDQGDFLFAQVSTAMDLETISDNFRATVEARDGSTIVSATTDPTGLFGSVGAPDIDPANAYQIAYSANQDTGIVTLVLNGVSYSIQGTPAALEADREFQSNRAFSVLAKSGGVGAMPAGVKCADLRLYFDDVLYAEIPNDAAAANAYKRIPADSRAWLQGAAFT